MDETGILLSLLKSIKVLVSKDYMKSYREIGVKRTLITALSVCLLMVAFSTR
jgi:hypothetical protein